MYLQCATSYLSQAIRPQSRSNNAQLVTNSNAMPPTTLCLYCSAYWALHNGQYAVLLHYYNASKSRIKSINDNADKKLSHSNAFDPSNGNSVVVHVMHVCLGNYSPTEVNG